MSAQTTRPQLRGLHHITAIVDDPQDNLRFYREVLGLRLVKRTVNFDDPYTYHLYYGDEAGTPGTIVTFFPWPSGRRGSRGTGQLSAFSLAVPAGALGYWAQRIDEYGLGRSEIGERFGERSLELYDPAGLLLELVETETGTTGEARERGPVPVERAIRGAAGVTLTVADAAPTGTFLTETLGFVAEGEQGGRARYRVGAGRAAARLDLVGLPGVARGQVAAGSIHHVAWRVRDEAEQLAWREAIAGAGRSVTPVRDRNYFRSIYFQEPGGAIFEIATDGPGFAVDEPAAALGEALKLPQWLEERRANIERHLPPLAQDLRP
jgi:glyoxalase family protein